eukprot:TRINITY_DN10531_c0_g1_i1.p1 TRINITY_DN10531_c0_g1~~TRINITY_DN10531_c0_g1_i1.p1  ORF type:complete len:250 (-),score=41.21 TRINITY_DN10531_c0_g1_i1:29-778(-)
MNTKTQLWILATIVCCLTIGTVATQYTLMELPYGYHGLEPLMSEQTLKVHHLAHHAGYTNKLNALLLDIYQDQPALEPLNVTLLLRDPAQVNEKYRQKLINLGGGYVNHNYFFKGLAPVSDKQEGPHQDLQIAKDIAQVFGSYSEFKEQFIQASNTVFGSGWTWLYYNNGELAITTSKNQDSVYELGPGTFPILALDLWEHAYYIQHHNKKANFIDNWFELVNWDFAENNLEQAKSEIAILEDQNANYV